MKRFDPPTLERRHPFSVPLEDSVYGAARCSIRSHPSESGCSLPCGRECHPEHMIKLLLQEFNFTFVDDELTTLKGFMVCEDGDRVISVARGLGCAERVFLYFHMLGHIVLGHIPTNGSGTIFEFRDRAQLPLHIRFQESRTDRWAAMYLESILRDSGGFDAGLIHLLKHALSRHTQQNGGTAAAWASRTSTALFEKYSLYRRLRTRAEPVLHRAPTDLVCV